MATNLTNSILTQIAVKRLSGKAMTSGRQEIPTEKYGSAVQNSADTLFGQTVPNDPSTTDYLIQSSSQGAPGTVQYVTFDLVTIAGTNYANSVGGDGQNSSSAATVFDQDLGDIGSTDTFHAYHLRLPSDYVTQTNTANGADGFDTYASTPKVLGTDAPFVNSYSSTGSVQFQVVPEYLSTIVGTANAYIPDVIATDGTTVISKTAGIDYYFDAFAGILFVQDPAAVAGDTPNASVPEKIKAFLYVGKYQSEVVSGDVVDLNISDGTNGFSIANNATSSFVTGSGTGLTISGSNDGTNSTLTFELNGVVSGSGNLWHISASAGGGSDIAAQETASFEDGGAGLTIKQTATSFGSRIDIGASNDDITVGTVTTIGDITAGGDIIANNYIINSTITNMTQSFSSGSTIFGDTLDDTHQFTGSISLSSSIFTWHTPLGNPSTTPLVYDVVTGKIYTGSEYVAGASGMTSFHISASGGDGFDITNLETASLKSANSQLTIVADASTKEFTFTIGDGVVSSSAQILDGTGILSSSTQNFADYSSSVETLILDATASIGVLVDEVDLLQASASAGIYFSASVGGGTSISLTQTASFIGGDGITVTNSGGTITIESDYGELDSSLYIGTGSTATNATGSSIAYGGTASFDASGTGLSVDTDGAGTITYTIVPNDVIEAVDTATVINITASYALTASFVTSSDVYGPFGADSVLSASYAVTASYVEGGSSTVQVTEIQTSATNFGIPFTDLSQTVLDGTDVNTDVTLQGKDSLAFQPSRNLLSIGAIDGSSFNVQSPGNFGVGPAVLTFRFLTDDIQYGSGLTTSGPTTILIGTSSGVANFKGSVTIDEDLTVKGTTTTLNTTNLLVEDKFILLNSGTLGSPADEGGIVVQTDGSGNGTALYFDDDAGRWIITDKDQVAGTSTSVTADITKGTNTMAAIVTVQVDDNAPDHSPFFNTTNFNQGQMYIDKSLTGVTDNNIWIYS